MQNMSWIEQTAQQQHAGHRKLAREISHLTVFSSYKCILENSFSYA